MYSDRLLTVRFKGGIANQVYQLAAALFFGNLLNRKISYTTTYYTRFKNPRPLVIDSIYDGALILGKDNKLQFLLDRINRKLDFDIRLFPRPQKSLLVDDSILIDEYEKHGSFSLSSWSASDFSALILDGYFHFDKILTRSGILSQMSILNGVETISLGIHVRLGDYLKPPYSHLYNLVNAAYIRESFNILVSHGMPPDVPIYVYSDCYPDACVMVQSALSGFSIMPRVALSAISELKSLSLHKYQILSNSSYSLLSWYLNANSISVIPLNWFKSQRTHPELFSNSSRLIRLAINS